MAQANTPGKMAPTNSAGVMPLGHPLQQLLVAMALLLLQELLHLLPHQEPPHLLLPPLHQEPLPQLLAQHLHPLQLPK
jgi:hypothetical protein